MCRRPDSHTFFCFCFICRFFRVFCTVSAFSLHGEYVVRSFLPNGVFLPCDHELDFFIFYISLCDNSINQSTPHSYRHLVVIVVIVVIVVDIVLELPASFFSERRLPSVSWRRSSRLLFTHSCCRAFWRPRFTHWPQRYGTFAILCNEID